MPVLICCPYRSFLRDSGHEEEEEEEDGSGCLMKDMHEMWVRM